MLLPRQGAVLGTKQGDRWSGRAQVEADPAESSENVMMGEHDKLRGGYRIERHPGR